MNLQGRLIAIFLASLLPCVQRQAWAASIFPEPRTSAAVLEVDPSVRCAGMGGAGTAVFWGVSLNPWANPALLGYAEGVRYEQSDAEFGPGVKLRARGTTIGYGGLGLGTTGRPIEGLGRIDLEATASLDQASLGLIDQARSWSAGASISRLLETLARGSGRTAPAFTRFADVAFGYSDKRVEDVLWVSSPGDNSRIAEHTFARDRGVMIHGGAPLRVRWLGPAWIDAAYGYSEVNFNQPAFDAFGVTSPTARDWRNGVALHATFDGTAPLRRLPRWFASGLAPFVSAGWAMDFIRTTQGEVGRSHDVDGWGAELGMVNILAVRMGRSGSSASGYVSHTWGVSFGLPLGRYGGGRWDHANVTRDGLPDLKRDGWTLWLDPLVVYHAVH